LTQSWSPACFTSAQKYEECWNYSIHHQQPTLAGHIVFAGDQVRLRSFSIGLIQYDWCSYKVEKFEHRHKYVYKGACHRKEKTEIGVMYLQANEYQRLPAASRGLERGLGQTLPYHLQRSHGAVEPWDLSF
jgi:hypothetical protein